MEETGNKGMDKRKHYLDYSLTFENGLSILLGLLLRIKDVKNSKSLGNSSSSLGFNVKVNLLLDMDFIPNSEAWKFQKFMQIRNQFMHNSDAIDYKQCVLFVERSDKKLHNEYKLSRDSQESDYENAAILLAENVLAQMNELLNKVMEYGEREAHKVMYEISHKAFDTALKVFEERTKQDVIDGNHSGLISFYDLLEVYRENYDAERKLIDTKTYFTSWL